MSIKCERVFFSCISDSMRRRLLCVFFHFTWWIGIFVVGSTAWIDVDCKYFCAQRNETLHVATDANFYCVMRTNAPNKLYTTTKEKEAPSWGYDNSVWKGKWTCVCSLEGMGWWNHGIYILICRISQEILCKFLRQLSYQRSVNVICFRKNEYLQTYFDATNSQNSHPSIQPKRKLIK